jgi:uncharacterized protein YcgI (DUF1989 family)
VVPKGHYLTIIDLEGQQGVDFLCYNADDPEERYHAPNTLKAIQTLKLSVGHNLYSDIARPIFTVTHDSCSGHDTIAGCCSAPSNEMLYAVKNVPGCRENFLTELARISHHPSTAATLCHTLPDFHSVRALNIVKLCLRTLRS